MGRMQSPSWFWMVPEGPYLWNVHLDTCNITIYSYIAHQTSIFRKRVPDSDMSFKVVGPNQANSTSQLSSNSNLVSLSL